MAWRRRWPWLAVAALLVSVIVVARGQRQVTPQASTGGNGEAKPVGTAGTGARGAGPRGVPVVAAAASTSDVPVYLNGLGTAAPYRTVSVKPRVDGQLMSVEFQEGQLVRQGQVLAQVDPRPFEVQLGQARGQLAKDQATLRNAELDQERYDALLKQDAIPRQQADTQRSTVNQLRGAIEADQAQVNAAQLNLTYARITAPIAGRIGLRQVDPGNIVHAADPNGIAIITQLQPITVVFTIPADSLPQVVPALRAGRVLQVEAWDRDLKTQLAVGALETTDNEIDTATGTVKLKAVFSNQPEVLFPNQFVNARLLVDTLRGVVTVPTAAVQRGPQGTFVWVIGAAGDAEIRACEVRLTEGDRSVIANGLAAGERVVVDGVDRLQQGAKVIPQDASGRRGAGQ
jgi:membrane fusion protein, multidrug efflux system